MQPYMPVSDEYMAVVTELQNLRANKKVEPELKEDRLALLETRRAQMYETLLEEHRQRLA
jgi:hypothetical protein